MQKAILLSVVSFVILAGAGCVSQNQPLANDYGKTVPPAATTYQVTLDLSNQQLTHVDQSVFTQTNLQELNLSHNKLTGALPSQINQLKNLVALNVSDNAMTGVPAEIGQLTNLEQLDLSNNQLTGLPNELGNLKHLKVLNLKGNNYSQQDLNMILKNLPASVTVIK